MTGVFRSVGSRHEPNNHLEYCYARKIQIVSLFLQNLYKSMHTLYEMLEKDLIHPNMKMRDHYPQGKQKVIGIINNNEGVCTPET